MPLCVPTLKEPKSTNSDTIIAAEEHPDNENFSSAAWLMVAGETRFLQEGECIVFDDSFLHEAANISTDTPRVVLIVDVWHPDLSDEEVKNNLVVIHKVSSYTYLLS